MPHYDYDKDYPFAAFITNLGKYNEGALVGEWVKFPTTPEKKPSIRERLEDAKRECGERKPPDKAHQKKPPEDDL